MTINLETRLAIFADRNNPRGLAYVARSYGVSRATVYRIINASRSQISSTGTTPFPTPIDDDPASKRRFLFDSALIDHIVERRKGGEPWEVIASQYGCSVSLLRMRIRERWGGGKFLKEIRKEDRQEVESRSEELKELLRSGVSIRRAAVITGIGAGYIQKLRKELAGEGLKPKRAHRRDWWTLEERERVLALVQDKPGLSAKRIAAILGLREGVILKVMEGRDVPASRSDSIPALNCTIPEHYSWF